MGMAYTLPTIWGRHHHRTKNAAITRAITRKIVVVTAIEKGGLAQYNRATTNTITNSTNHGSLIIELSVYKGCVIYSHKKSVTSADIRYCGLKDNKAVVPVLTTINLGYFYRYVTN